MSQLVQPGEHLALVTDYAVTVTQNGNPMVTVKFKTDQGEVFWNGVLREAAEGKRNITAEALIVMGMTSISQFEQLADGPASGVLNMEQPVSIQVTHENYNGKTYAKAQFVNRVGGGGKFKNAMSKADLKVKLAGIPGLRADFAKAWQEAGVQSQPRPSTSDLDNIPF